MNSIVKFIVFTRIPKVIRKIDDLIFGIIKLFLKKRMILFHGNNSMNYYKFEPIYKRIMSESSADIYFCFSDFKYDKPEKNRIDITQLEIPENRILSVRLARLKKWDTVFDADFFTPWFYRNTYYVQIFHGVAGKSPKSKNYNCNPLLKKYDLCLFINKLTYEETRKMGLWKKDDSGEIVGMCCLDEMIENNKQNTIEKLKREYVPRNYSDKRIILYAPTWGEHSSFISKGRDILSALAKMDAFIIIKPHPLCLNRNMDISVEPLDITLKSLFYNNNYLLITGSPYEVMNISDIMITDYSSIAFEYSLLRKPIFLFISNNTASKVADSEQLKLLSESCYLYSENSIINEYTFNIWNLTEEKLKKCRKLSNYILLI